MELLEGRDEILVQMQSHAAAGDPALATPVRREFMRLIEHVDASPASRARRRSTCGRAGCS